VKKKKRSLLYVIVFGFLATCCATLFYKQSFTKPHDVAFKHALKYALLSKAAYGSDSAIVSICQELGYESVIIKNEPTYKGRVFVATDTGREVYTISVRGTSNMENALTDARVIKKKSKALHIRVHKGFLLSSKAIKSLIDSSLIRKHYGIETTGHSLGGAQALVLAMLFDEEGWNITKVMTYGQPKVTDINGVREFDSLPVLRFQNKDDIVPMVPSIELISFISDLVKYHQVDFYRHLGPKVVLLDNEFYAYLEKQDIETGFAGLLKGSLYSNLFEQKKADGHHELIIDKVKEDLPNHYIDNYIKSIEKKIELSVEVPFKDKDQYIRMNEEDDGESEDEDGIETED